MVEIEVLADSRAERGDERLDLVVAERPVEPRPLDVEDLAAQREDRLGLRIAPSDGGAAGRVALDDVDLRLLGASALAVAQLARHAAGLEQALAARRLARLAGGEAGGRRLKGLADHVARVRGVRVEPVAQALADDLLHEGLRLGVAQLGLGLALELGLAQLDAEDGRQALADVVSREVLVLVLEDSLLPRVLVDEGGEGGTEPLFVGAPLRRRDGVRVGEHGLGVGVRPLHGEFERDRRPPDPRPRS